MAAITLVQIDTNAPTQFNLISLPDPANDDDTSSSSPRDYILVSSRTINRQSSSGIASQQKQQQPSLDIHEIQTVLPHSGKYASYFVGSRIISNPLLHISTRIDPLFFALSHFQRILSKNDVGAEKLAKWQPYDQVVGLLPSTILRALNLDPNLTINNIHEVGQLSHILDVSDMCGDDLILCKFSEERTMQWLLQKFHRSVEALRVRLNEKRQRAMLKKKELSNMQGGAGAYSSSFVVAEEENGDAPKDAAIKDSGGEISMDSDTLTNEEEHCLKVAGLQLLCDYIPAEWKRKLCKEVGLDDMDWMGKKKPQKSSVATNGEDSNIAGEKKRSRAAWEGTIGQDDADALMQYTQGSGGGKSSSSVSVTPGKKSSVQEAKSVGLKKLAKVNTKGMKSLSSFFGAKKK
ncbi:hypothetical protein ACHAWU_002574 [Discostella pseudostelligera]|uniref:Uncharacterized protein n=1 Tax=Discostella pseudostelligera TaxID=259834 RepID=A0ABD3M1Q7_9STRA